MHILKSLCAAFSMYSRIPVPQDFSWGKRDMQYTLAFFPLVGAVIGLISFLFLAVDGMLPESSLFVRTCILCIIPIIVTGGIHLDGFLDTSDALNSGKARKAKLEILKDPHIGAFAVIRFAVLAAFYAASVSMLKGTSATLYCLIFVLSRILSGISAVKFANARGEGTLYSLSCASRSKENTLFIILAAEAGIVLFLMAVVNPIEAMACAVGAGLCFVRYWIVSDREFGGITGDIAGWFLCLCETTMAVVLAVCSRLGI